MPAKSAHKTDVNEMRNEREKNKINIGTEVHRSDEWKNHENYSQFTVRFSYQFLI